MRGNKVVAPGPEAAGHEIRWKRERRTLTVWINGDGDIGVNSHTGQDPIATKDWVRRKCGLTAWTPKKRKRRQMPPLAERGQYLSESLRIARDRKRITFEQFGLIINDLKNACSEGTLKARAACYAREFGFAPAETEAALHQQWRAYTASERAAMFQITYDEYRRLRLRRSGCIEIDPAERRRLTKQRYNAKRRAAHAAIRISKSAAYRAPLCPFDKSGTVRVPSLLKVVGKQEPSWKRREISPNSKTSTARDCCNELEGLESYRLRVLAEDGSDCRGDRIDRSERHPVMAGAIVQFWARAMPELFPAEGPAKGKVRGKQTDPRVEAATRKDRGYRNECSRSLFAVAAHGGAYKKTFRNTLLDTTQGIYVPAEHFLVRSHIRVQKLPHETVRGGEHESVRPGTYGRWGQRQGLCRSPKHLASLTDHANDQRRHRAGGRPHHTKPP